MSLERCILFSQSGVVSPLQYKYLLMCECISLRAKYVIIMYLGYSKCKALELDLSAQLHTSGKQKEGP